MKNKDAWTITTKRYVAYVDIMGFKDMVARSTHEEIYDMMRLINERRTVNQNLDWGRNDKPGLVRTTTYSDSIMIYSKDSSYDSLYAFICTVAALTADLFLERIPHKGAFAFGTMTLDTNNNIFFGQPLIDAFLLQDEIFFYGIVGHASAEKEIGVFLKEQTEFFVVNYPCPFKNGISKHLTIYPIAVGPSFKEFEFLKLYQKMVKSISDFRYMTSGGLRKYIEHTEAYISYIAKKHGI